MDNLSAGDLAIEVEADAQRIALVWRGKSNDRYPKKTLAPFFERVFEAAASEKMTVEMHFETLEYLNSSTISALVGVIRELRERAVPLVISFDARLKWQKLCFEALRVFEKPDGLLVMRTVGP